jgi:hypothetical protein
MSNLASKLQVNHFDGFEVYNLEDNHTFWYANYIDKKRFLNDITDYFLSEDNLLNYNVAKSRLSFDATPKIYAKLYKNINIFLNSELEELILDDDISYTLRNVLDEEYHLIDDNGTLRIQKDKIGKMGEYIFHIILSKYFKLDCIIPKFRCTTDRNMSVFGIDALFLNTEDKMIYFGESKFTKNLSNGIKLINKSLENYESQIKEEYKLILSSTDAFKLSSDFIDIFEDELQICISFEDFVDVSGIKKIGVPIFIIHGNDKPNYKPIECLNMLIQKVKQKKFFNLDTYYIAISVPVISKNEFMEIIMKKVVKKNHEYEGQLHKSK